ncbi:Gfo/Idh/MocA family protein [Laceyella putida]|uniref:Gfo/Idh/MocA family protein n=1 Tax=Laceyella putida TaxID=110101 RepID=A0ABW2RQ08_9BACL
MKKCKVGIIGCGVISGIYMQNIKEYPHLELVACADLVMETAQKRAEEFHIPKVCTVDELLSDPDIDIVVNLTIPAAHGQICLRALEAGKHVYVEKPLAATREEGRKILESAKQKGLRVACAPETFLGGGIQTCRQLIEDGDIGTPIAATGNMLYGGPDAWHPNPHFFFQPGAGPLFDMGPYYLTALVTLLGPIKQIMAQTKISFPERKARVTGETIKVNTPTHVTGILEFANGTLGTVIFSFDVKGGHHLPNIEIYGTEGTIRVPDPNTFGGPVLIKRVGNEEWAEVEIKRAYTDNSRGIGVAEMALAILEDRPHRANGDLAYHILDAMYAFYDSAEKQQPHLLESRCEVPAIMPHRLF